MSYEVFPLDSALTGYGTTYTPSWKVTEKISANGTRRAITHQLLPAWKFVVTFPMLDEDQMRQLVGFYNKCKGTLIPFFWKDYFVGEYYQEKLPYSSNFLGYQFMHTMDGYRESCPKADDVKGVFVNGKYKENVFYHEKADGSGCYITYSGMSSLDDVKADFHGYFLVHFASSITISEKSADFYTAKVTLEVVR